MPKHTKNFTVWSSVGDQHGESTDTYPVNPSDIKQISKNISKLIADGNAEQVAKTLSQDFIYPGCISKWSTNNDCSKGDWWQEGYETYKVRPVIEALFFEHNELFRNTIGQIKQSEHSRALYDALIKSIQHTDLASSALFSWNDTMKQRVLIDLSRLSNYGKKLDEKNIPKGKQAMMLANQLSSELTLLNPAAEKTPHQKDLHILDIKLQFLKTLHSKDKVFNVHRGYIRAVNIATILFTAGIANALYAAVTGNFLFFNKTTTQEKVADVQDSLGLTLNK